MDVKRNFQIERYWIPTTPAKPSVAQSQPICEDKLENQDSNANFLESGRVLHRNHIDQANWQESDILSTGFLEESRINEVVASSDTTSFIDVNKRLDIWEEGFRWSNIPFGDLLALADAATSSTSAPATSIPVSTSAPANSSMADNNQSLENSNFVPDIHQHGFSIPSRPSFDLNSPPQMTTAEVLRESVSSKFAPETPDQARRAGRNQVSEIRNSGIEERTNQARDEQDGEVATEIVEGNELLHEIEQSQLHKDQSCAAVSTHLQEEDHNPDKGGNQGTDLNKKPRRKRHRPKVVIEGKPSKARNPRTPKPDGPTETPRVKRKYVRKKGLEKPPATPSEVTSGNTNPKTVESTEKSCRRSLNFDFESQVRDESSSGRPPSNIDSESLARNLGTKVQSTVQLGEGMQVRVDSRQVGIAYDVTRSMNDALREYLSRPERLVPNPPTPSKTDDTLRDKLMADAQNACARGKCRIVFSDETHDKLMTDAQNVCTRGKCRIVYSDKTHDKEASNVQMIINTNAHSAPRSQNDSNCSCSACLTQGKQARGLKRGHSSITDEVQLTSMNASGSNYNSLRDYLANFPVNICSNATIPGMHFPAIFKKKRTEKMNSSAASSTLSTVTAAQNPVRQTMESSAQTKISSLSCSQEEQHSFKCMLALGHAEKSKKKRSKVPTRVRDLASLIGIVERIQLPTSSTREATTSDVMQGFESSHQPHTCMEALAADTRATKATKKRTKRNSLLGSVPPNIHNHQQFLIKSMGPPRGMIWKGIDYIDALVERFRRLDINAKGKRVGVRKQNALIPYNMRYQEQNALVLYRRDGTVVPFEGSFDPIKKRRPRPKVDLDDETTRVWKLLLQDINSQGIDGTDEEKAKWWEEERRVFRGRADSFIARMHLVQGDRRFSMWKGSVVDSVVGVFLTQNVSDHLSSSAFMSLAARFPLKSNSNHGPSNEEKTTRLVQEPEVCVLDPEDTIGWHEEKSNQPACDQSSMTLQDVEYNEEKEVINSNESFGSSTDEVRSKDNPNSKLFDYSTNGLHICHESAVYRSATQITGVAASFMGDHRELDDVISSQTSVVSSQNSVDSSMAQTAERTGSCSKSNSEAELIAMSKPNSFGGPTSFLELLQKMAGTTMSNRVNNQDSANKSSSRKIGRNQLESMACESQEQDKDRSPMPPSNYHFHLTPNSRDLEVECFDMLGKESRFSGIPKKNEENCASEQSGLSAESASQATVQKIVTESSRGAPKSSIENNHPCDNLQPEMNKTFQSQRIAEEGSNIKSQTPENNRKVQQDLHVQNFSRETFDVTESTNTSKAKSTRIGKEKQIPVDWDSLRKQAQANGKREKAANTMDSVDWEAIRCADVNEIAHTIRERGMNNMLAERIKDFLNRLVRDHGSIDLEWLRDVPPDKAKEYLLSIRGLGLKSVECVRLLTLHHLAFPVDTNVGRIAVRLGWVPLQPLPESLQLHLLELYPILESIQKYLWPRLCKLDQRTLYELHYQMITFGKVFCTKSKPNCNACPMRGECRHFASAFASARLALPAPEEKSIVNTTENIAADQTHTVIVNRLQLPPPQANQQLEMQSEAINCNPIIEEPVSPEPIIEMPATPEPERIHISECDIEDTCEDPDEIPTCEDPDEIPTIKLNIEEFTQNLQNYMQQNMELQEGDVSKALVALTPEAASIPMPKLKNVSRLRTEHHVYELPDSHPLLEGLDKREPDDPCSYLLAIWTPGETAESIQPPEGQCSSQESGKLCDEETCFSCNNIREANSQSVRGTLLIPCRTAMRGSFPLNGTYFQVNEVFADHESSLNPIDVPRSWLWNLPRRTVYFGTSIPTIFKGLSTEGIQYCFWRGFVCVRGFDQRMRAPRPLMARLHFPASKLVRNKGKPDEN